jgi:hypothetical protein
MKHAVQHNSENDQVNDRHYSKCNRAEHCHDQPPTKERPWCGEFQCAPINGRRNPIVEGAEFYVAVERWVAQDSAQHLRMVCSQQQDMKIEEGYLVAPKMDLAFFQ